LFFNRIWQIAKIRGENASENRNNSKVKFFYLAAVEPLWNRVCHDRLLDGRKKKFHVWI